MKRITFLIGNGFDVNVGLDTRYRDFYEYYKVKCWDDRLAKSIKSNYKYWADLEVGLGKYTVQIKRGQEESFWESEQNLERMLAEYLEGQMGRIQWDGEEKRRAIALKMKESLLEFYSELQDREKAYIRNYISKTSESIGYSFISFNYTDTLKRCLEIANNIINGQINTRGALFKGRRYRDVISEVLYIHGTTSEGMVLGVNDAGQIANRDFRNSSRHLVKKEINKAIAQERISEACKMIDESMIVCIFGMSIGNVS